MSIKYNVLFILEDTYIKRGRYIDYGKKPKELSKDYSYIYKKEDSTEKVVNMIKQIIFKTI